MLLKLLLQSNLPDSTCREIVSLFAEDYTATDIATLTGVSRVTVNHLVKLLRQELVRHCGEKAGEATGRKATAAVADPGGSAVYGLLPVEGKLFTEVLPGPFLLNGETGARVARARRELFTRVGNEGSYAAVADFDGWELYRLRADAVEIETVELFWAETCSRLRKFRGLRRSSLHLHIKESEFRFNNRDGHMPRLLSLLLNQSGGARTICR